MSVAGIQEFRGIPKSSLMPRQHSSSTLLPSTRMTSMDKRTLIFSLSKRLLDSPHKHIGLLRELLEPPPLAYDAAAFPGGARRSCSACSR